jgi:esterase/lipase
MADGQEQDFWKKDWHGRCKGGSHVVTILSLNSLARFSAVALLALGMSAGVVRGAESATSADAKKAAAAAAAAKERAKKTSPAELKKLLEEMSKERDVMIAEYDALVKQMKDASEEKKKEIREKLEAQSKKFEEVSNALLKQIRDEQRKQRQNAGKR